LSPVPNTPAGDSPPIRQHGDLARWPDASTVGTWYFYAGTFDGATYKIYFNGVLNGSSADSTALITNNLKELNIGYLDVNGSPGRFFPGTIDDVRIYNRALSAQEIYQLSLMGK
jgi:hypothetical protein